MRPSKGFTLMELMIVVGVMAILSMIALPSFLEYTRKGKRAEATTALADIQLREERFRADNPTYGDTTSAAVGTNLFGSTAAAATYNTLYKNYSVAVTGTSATGYTATATRKGSMVSDPKCANFTIVVTNGTPVKGTSDAKNVDYCWRQ